MDAALLLSANIKTIFNPGLVLLHLCFGEILLLQVIFKKAS